MKRGLIFLLWISAVFVYGQPAPASSNHADDERAIRRLNEEALKAYNLGDVKTLDRVEGADFTLTGDFGEVPKQQQLDRVRHRKEYASTAHLIVADERFRFYGDAALLTEVERYGDGEDFPRYETTSLWVQQGGNWKLVHLHYSKLSK